ncbi:hypothetical protein Btru_037081 [Bulinus truncatus]|nr:hypothetical protein Btru_037081 [Bulinus truncatus]
MLNMIQSNQHIPGTQVHVYANFWGFNSGVLYYKVRSKRHSPVEEATLKYSGLDTGAWATLKYSGLDTGGRATLKYSGLDTGGRATLKYSGLDAGGRATLKYSGLDAGGRATLKYSGLDAGGRATLKYSGLDAGGRATLKYSGLDAGGRATLKYSGLDAGGRATLKYSGLDAGGRATLNCREWGRGGGLHVWLITEERPCNGNVLAYKVTFISLSDDRTSCFMVDSPVPKSGLCVRGTKQYLLVRCGSPRGLGDEGYGSKFIITRLNIIIIVLSSIRAVVGNCEVTTRQHGREWLTFCFKDSTRRKPHVVFFSVASSNRNGVYPRSLGTVVIIITSHKT